MPRRVNPRDLASMHEERTARWKILVTSDPRRAVRALAVIGLNSETIDGDTLWDTQYVLQQLSPLAADPKSEVWKRLVNAGLFDALCFCVLNAQAAAIVEDETRVNQAQVDAEGKKLPSPWALSLQIICTATVSCGNTATAVETKMIEDLKKNWGQMMQRIWSQPFNSLDPDVKGVVERILVAQTAMRLTVLDPSFLGELSKPSDLTFAVCFRNWMHSIAREDALINAGFLLALLDHRHIPQYWKSYTDVNPLPPMKVLLPRILLGASKTPGPAQRKRTPQQAAEAIVAATVTHLTYPNAGLQEYELELAFLRSLFVHATTEYPALPRAMFKSPDLWAATALVLRRAAEAGTQDAEGTYLDALETFSRCTFAVNKEGNEFADAMIAGWLEGGLFEAFEDTLDFFVKIRGATSVFVVIMSAILQCSPKLSAKTQALLRTHLPRQRLSERLAEEFGHDGKDQTKYQADYAAFTASMQSGTLPDVDNPMWGQAAWETLDSVTELFQATELSPCSRSGCEKQVASGNEVKCVNCNVQYCSKQCFKRDFQEHKGACSDPKRRPPTAREILLRNHAARDGYFRRRFIAQSLIFVVIAIVLYYLLHGIYGLMGSS
ncbi:hypothetical protein BD311DRAFT_775595 [Dichomitus squalens]|uniref:MYND-type domain-containing protein n=1 Tax=Dichomitus squalens TaxID=114155 RepID=A0A4Q9MVK4_9APHY|nr:hypothetical protein BD311DRAFT_775595 [Dichomitus squalens]